LRRFIQGWGSTSIANVVVFAEGKHWTPPREAGLLAGTLRDELISKGKLFERTITKRELTECGSFTLINSVRGWMQAELSNAPAGEAALKVDEVNDVILQVAANRSEARAVRETPAQSR
jgi:branched-subunit amino acid aminotransferase/4-amino-4-deoxychorismate lyase